MCLLCAGSVENEAHVLCQSCHDEWCEAAAHEREVSIIGHRVA